MKFFDKQLNEESQIYPSTANSAYLLVGLGNPGRTYHDNRHNVGYMVIDRLAARLGVSFTRLESKALVTKTEYQDYRLILAKPQTYMNLSGTAVGALQKYYKIPFENSLIAYDDVDLPFGTIRLRHGGGSAGQKGMGSIIDRLGTQDIPRLRVGIDHPPGRMEAAAYVLEDFSKPEQETLPSILDRAVEAIFVFITLGLDAAMNQYNG